MFYRITKDFNFILGRHKYRFYINKNNLLKKNQIYITKLYKKVGSKNYNNFIFLIFSEWIEDNFSYTSAFIKKFFKIVKKFKLDLNAAEREFIYFVEEINFTLWRPLKTLPIKIDLEKNEKCLFKNKNSTLLIKNSKNNQWVLLNQGNLYFTNKKIIISNEKKLSNKGYDQFQYSDIKEWELKNIGVQFTHGEITYLIRTLNKIIIWAILSRLPINPKIEFNRQEHLFKLGFREIEKIVKKKL